ncbi:MAG: class I SAM-dependent methyltransferase [Promethearchaeota archaeon]
MDNSEKNRLDRIAESYLTRGFNVKLVYYGFISLKPFFKQGNCLELGCAEGVMTEYLVNYFESVVAVDGSDRFCELTRNNIKSKNLLVICSLFEDFKPKKRFNTIMMAHILEHVENPLALLKKVRNWITDDGVILIIVPNADSINRQVGVKMGLLKKVNELNNFDKEIGHRRVYNWDLLKEHIRQANLRLKKMWGNFYKPLSNAQIHEWFTEDMIEAFYELGKDYPQYCTEILAVCGNSE